MIVLFTDFGLHGPYTGQVKAVLHQMAPRVPAIDLFADAPVGNPKASAMTGLRAAILPPNAKLAAAGRLLERERTFSDRPLGAAFWYENSNGLAEIAVNQGRADRDLGLAIGSPVEIVS